MFMERVSYPEIKQMLLATYWNACKYHSFSGWTPRQVWVSAYDDYQGSYDFPIEYLMLEIAYYGLSGGWYPNPHGYHEKEIARLLSCIDLNHQLKEMPQAEAEEFQNDVRILDLFECPAPASVDLCSGLQPSENKISKNLKSENLDAKRPEYFKIRDRLLSTYWIGCRDHGFSGWLPEQVRAWAYAQFKGSYSLPIEQLILELTCYALSGWYPDLTEHHKKEIMRLLPSIDLNAQLKQMSEEDADQFENDLKILKFI